MSVWRRWRELPLAEQLYYGRAYALGRRTLWDDAAPDRPAFLDRIAPGRALDAGCGAGRNAIALAQRGWRVFGLDLYRAALHRAHARAAQAGVEVVWIHGAATTIADLGLPPLDLVVDVFGPASDLSTAHRHVYAHALERALASTGLLAIFTFEEPREMQPFLERFTVDHTLTQIAPASSAGRWWLLRPRAATPPAPG